jgi:hypothetical protein
MRWLFNEGVFHDDASTTRKGSMMSVTRGLRRSGQPSLKASPSNRMRLWQTVGRNRRLPYAPQGRGAARSLAQYAGLLRPTVLDDVGGFGDAALIIVPASNAHFESKGLP